MEKDNLDKIKSDVAFEHRSRDGITQIAIGVFLLLALLNTSGGRTAFVPIFIALVPTFIESLRRKITYPRIGYAKLKEPRNTSGMILTAAIIFLLAGGFLVFQKADTHSEGYIHLRIYLLMSVGVLVFIAALFRWKQHRDRLYYLIFAVIAVLTVLIGKFTFDWMFWLIRAFAVFNLGWGAYRLVTFIRANPVIHDEQ